MMGVNLTADNKTEKKSVNLADYGVYLITALIFVAFSASTKVFLSGNNIIQLISNCASMLVVCAGMTFVIITGALDLSVGSVLLLSGMMINLLVQAGVPTIPAILCALLAGTLIGAINGFCVMRLKANAFLVTYGTQIAIRGFALTISNNASVYTSQGLKDTLRFQVAGIPLFILLAVLLILVAQFVLKYTAYGRKVIAVGCNETGAAKIGIRTKLVKGSVFAISGLCAAIAGLITVVNVGTCAPYTGNGIEFTGAAAILMGGTSMYGGKGSIVPGTLIGVFLLQMMENGLTILGIDPYYLSLVRGALIFIAMFVDSLKNRR